MEKEYFPEFVKQEFTETWKDTFKIHPLKAPQNITPPEPEPEAEEEEQSGTFVKRDMDCSLAEIVPEINAKTEDWERSIFLV
jgi:hypothetical protein